MSIATHHDPFTILNSTRFGTAPTGADPRLNEYWSKGYIALRGIFTPADIASWQAECDRLLKADFVEPYNIRTPFRWHSGGQPERLDPVIDVSPLFAALAKDRRILDVVESIFHDQAPLFKDKIIFKAPGTHGYTMHQDQAYWQLCPATGVKIETAPGDVLIFHSLAPHQSGINTATVSRRSFYLTYSAARSGDFYAPQLKNYLQYNIDFIKEDKEKYYFR